MEHNQTITQTISNLYETHANELFGFCVSKVRQREEAMDIVHDAFIKYFTICERGEVITNPRAMLYTIVRNKIIDGYRSVALQRVFPISDELEQTLTSQSTSAADIVDVRSILNTINEMPDQIRELLLYRYIDGLAVNEIADILGISPNTATQRIKRALSSLKKQLQIP